MLPTAVTREHELVAFRIDAYREMRRFAILGLRVLRAFTALLADRRRRDNDIGNLKSKACPGAQSFPAAMNSENSPRDLKLGDVRILLQDNGSEKGGVELGSPRRICRPDRVLDFFHRNHAR